VGGIRGAVHDTTLKNDGSLRYATEFIIKRFARIWPVYVAAIIVNLMLSPHHFGIVLSSWDMIWFYTKSMFFIPNDATKPPFFDMPYAVGWTLNYEVYFYLVFGISLLFGRLRWLALAAWFAATLIAIPIHTAGHAGLDIQRTNDLTSAYLVMITNPIIWEFAVGVVVGLIYHSELSLPRHPLTYVFLFATTAFAIWYDFSWHGTFNGLDQWGAPLPLMLLVMALASKKIEFDIPRAFVWLGGVSYSLYLFHPIASDGLRMLMSIAGLAWLIQTWWCVVGIVAVAMAVAFVANSLLENGLSVWLRDWLLSLIDRRNDRSPSSHAHG
jgi:exopolysaccharide production protein ExoZ